MKNKARLVKILSMHLPPPPMPAPSSPGAMGPLPLSDGGGDPMQESIIQQAIDRAMANAGGGGGLG